MSNKRAIERKKRRDAERAQAELERQQRLEEQRRYDRERQALLGTHGQRYEALLDFCCNYTSRISGPAILALAIDMHINAVNLSVYVERGRGDKTFWIDAPGEDMPGWQELRVKDRHIARQTRDGYKILLIPGNIMAQALDKRISEDNALDQMAEYREADRRFVQEMRRIRKDLENTHSTPLQGDLSTVKGYREAMKRAGILTGGAE